MLIQNIDKKTTWLYPNRQELVDGTVLKDFRTEYAKSGASTCRTCEEKIPKARSFVSVLYHTVYNGLFLALLLIRYSVEKCEN
jgi:hypothetical protein